MVLHKPINILTKFLTVALCVTLCQGNVGADEEFDAAFESSNLPWYDAENNNLKSSDAPTRSGSVVSDRNRIPLLRNRKQGQQIPKQMTPPAAGATGSAFGNFGTGLIYFMGIVLALVLIGLLVYGFLKLESGEANAEESGKKKRNIRDHIKHLPFEIEEQDGDFETFAEKSLRAGDYSKAVIYLFADLLVAMSESGVVRLQRGKTNRQYLNDIWDLAEIKPYYQKVMTAFEDAFFGKHEIEKSRAEDCFAGRAGFDSALEKIRQARFTANQRDAAPLLSQNIQVEGLS